MNWGPWACLKGLEALATNILGTPTVGCPQLVPDLGHRWGSLPPTHLRLGSVRP